MASQSDDRETSGGDTPLPEAVNPIGGDEIAKQRVAIEWARLKTEQQKVDNDYKLRSRELDGRGWRDLFTNPFSLAVVGGFITLMTTIITSHLTASSNASAAKESLQADLIKKFSESSEIEIVRENLRFLVDAGLLPSYEDKIKAYLKANPNAAPQAGNASTTLLDLTYFKAGLVVDTDGPCGPLCSKDPTHSDETSLKQPDGTSLDPTKIPYIVLPAGKTKDNHIALGDFAAVYNTSAKKLAFAIFADFGPATKLGEGSIALAEALGLPSNWGHVTPDGIVYVVFPNSHTDNNAITPELIAAEGKKQFERWGGDKELQRRLQSPG